MLGLRVINKMSIRKMRFRENYIGLYTIIRREITRFLRIWTQTFLPSIISIALYFLIFGNLIGPRIGEMGGYRYIDYLVPGLIMMSIITNSYANVVGSFFTSKFQRNIEEMLVSPMSNGIILLGYVLGGVVRGTFVGVLVTIVSLFFTKLNLQYAWMTLMIGALTALLFSLAGLANGIFAKKFDDINIIPTFVLTPLTYLGGVFYSVNLLPDFWQKVTYLNPLFYMVNAFRYGMLGYSDINVHVAIGVIVSLTITLYILCVWLMRKGVGIRT
jgi:ABC-2 type transport system permease protein